ncbi:MAG: Bor family protein [Gemmatimonadaceae bacterium]|nr:Bor family protein [Gemmatimonadaceae bacterium]
MRRSAVMLTALALLTTGCYHTTITTGRPMSETTIMQPWALSFIYGLVPPPTVETASKCPSGVAQVETQLSFLNGLVGSLTFGIVTPMTIKVTCAGSGRSEAPGVKSQGDAVKAISAAADLAHDTGAPVLVRF